MDTHMVDAPFRLSARAAAQISTIVQGQPPDGPQALRVAVLAGGCSGFQYRFELDGTRAEDDLVVERDGATLLTTETRILGTDPASRRVFGCYWLIIRGPSGLIRRSWLAAIDRRARA